jgi:hypothetical protein
VDAPSDVIICSAGEEQMSDNPKKVAVEGSNLEKDPDDWVTGEEPMTGAQASYLKTLCEEAHQEFTPELTKAEASKRIDALREQTGKA